MREPGDGGDQGDPVRGTDGAAMSDFKPTTPPNTPERLAEAERWMAREAQAAVDQFQLAMRDAAEEVCIFREGIEILADLFPLDGEDHP
jgi:hypothetical protein